MSAIPNINEVVAAATANASSQGNNASSDTGGCSDCQMCQKSPGLVILPVRYAAIAESHAHGIDGLVPITSGGNFGDGVLDKSMQKASYILRCMRFGYFYLHFPNGDADGIKWRKYRVTSDSNFIPLPIDGLAAPGIEKTVACRSSTDWQMARCVTISQPEKVTQAWLAFSDTDWDNTVRDQVAQNPSQRMQFLDPSLCISPATSQPHTAPLSTVTDWVSEYRHNTEQSFSSIVADKDDSQNTATFESIYPYHWRAFEADDLIGTAERTSQGRSIIFATHDPRGITVELNAEQIQAVSASLQRYSWVLSSTHGIRSIRAAVEEDAERDYRDSILGREQNNLDYTNSQIEEINSRYDNVEDHEEILNRRTMLEENRNRIQDRLEHLEKNKIDEARLARIRRQAWDDTREGDTYLRKSDEAIDEAYNQALDDIQKATKKYSDLLSIDHATWLKSESLSKIFSNDYVTNRLDSGVEYVEDFIECIEEASDRHECAEVLKQWVSAGDISDSANIYLRCLGHNQDSHIFSIKETSSPVTLQNAANVLDGYRRVWESSREKVFSSHNVENAARNAYARLIHQSGAPIARLLSNGLDQAVTRIFMAASMLSTDRILIQRDLKGTPAQHISMIANQSRELIPANKRPTQQQMKKVIREWLKKSGVNPDIKVPHFFYLDEAMLTAAAEGHGARGEVTLRLLRSTEDILLTSRNIRESILPNFREIIDSDVRMSSIGLFFSAISVYYADNALDKASPFKNKEMQWRFYSSIITIIGGISELASKGLNAMKVGGYLRVRRGFVVTLDIFGRVFGAIGAWILAGWDGMNALNEAKRGNGWLSFLYFLSTLSGIGLGFSLIMVSLEAIAFLFAVGLLLSILISVFSIEDTQNWLNHCLYGQADRFKSISASDKELSNVLE
ncbi:T6SS effector BTH_I2691 family protein [Cobetia amphilecti]|uniref:T6SS effector BTH_I2691 family protein n=1 Tax=Cobetia amphilecti TaxID=1055104 RepID=UPI0024497CE2|nr:T6SS effector BTH_I2691 family protein [Cobetia litoralis]MDH2420309.1 T6SS effector BTH_I2691 family protein [Cobetia litoralis]